MGYKCPSVHFSLLRFQNFLTCGSIYGTINTGGEYTLTKYDKLYTKIVNNPKDVNFGQLDKVLKQNGFKCRQPRKGSSHYIYHHPDLPDLISIPKTKPVKAVYVKNAIEAIEKLKEKG